MAAEDEETSDDRIYRFAKKDLTAALEGLSNRYGIPLPTKRLYTKEDYIRVLARMLLQRLGPHALDSASGKAADQTLKLFSGGRSVVAMCHAHFLDEMIG